MVDPEMQLAISEQQAERDSQWRHAALGQACHDLKGGAAPSTVVERASVYYEFLRNPAKSTG